ncbi:MAG: polysaccharide deacetylase family protein [Candidatus Parcubacteria bacterium]|nr:polysaccharide deacetylase family protein [Candidatus Parcubacteria bacterium]
MNNKVNILQIDVEDWYCDLDFKSWESREDRILQSTNKVLTLLKERNTKATFFILGYIAERFPQLVKKIKEEGHEIASHGYNHTPITKRTPPEFEEDLLKSIRILEKISGDKIWGYRAPQFSVVEKTSWAIGILKKNGLRYDSSVFPVKLPLYSIYGVPDAPLFPYRISLSDIKKEDPKENFLEFPLSVYRIPILKRNIPIAGGFYLRFFPYGFISHAIKKINKANHPAICYLHPWELDPGQPRIKSLEWYHYYRLGGTEKKFKRLLKDFKFTSTKKWIENNYGK